MKRRILLADPSKELVRHIIHADAKSPYTFETAFSGQECLQQISDFQPELVFIDLLLPGIHGIEILKKIRSDPAKKKIGVIIASAQAMIQNYHAALNAGADYFLEKPFENDHLFEIIARFFEGTLTPAPFSGKESGVPFPAESYEPHVHVHNSYLKFWGTRGSNPVSGREYIRYGGNTCCLEVRHGNDLIIIDAGTGIRSLSNVPSIAKAKSIHLLLSHTHWDHILGFPFFNPIYNPDVHLTIWSPIGYERTTKELFTEMLNYAYFPVRLDDIRAKLIFKDMQEGLPFSIGPIEIHTHYAYHPGATLCFKIKVAGYTFGYATDNEMLMGYHGSPNSVGRDHPLLLEQEGLIQFYKDCDFLIHEAQYFPKEYQGKVGWGHSSITNAAVLLKYANIKEWIVTHHDPEHSDDDLSRKIQWHHDVIDECKIPCRVRMAFDGLTIPF